MVTIEDKDAARAAAYRDREIAAAPQRPQVPAGDSGRHQGPPQQGNYPTQGYPGRDAPTGPPPGYRPPDGDRPHHARHAAPRHATARLPVPAAAARAAVPAESALPGQR